MIFSKKKKYSWIHTRMKRLLTSKTRSKTLEFKWATTALDLVIGEMTEKMPGVSLKAGEMTQSK